MIADYLSRIRATEEADNENELIIHSFVCTRAQAIKNNVLSNKNDSSNSTDASLTSLKAKTINKPKKCTQPHCNLSDNAKAETLSPDIAPVIADSPEENLLTSEPSMAMIFQAMHRISKSRSKFQM